MGEVDMTLTDYVLALEEISSGSKEDVDYINQLKFMEKWIAREVTGFCCALGWQSLYYQYPEDAREISQELISNGHDVRLITSSRKDAKELEKVLFYSCVSCEFS